MFRLGRSEFGRLVDEAHDAYPREACGLLFAPAGWPSELRLVPTVATWNTPVSFRIAEQEINRVRRRRRALGEDLLGCFHSHVLSRAWPSKYDRQGAQRLGGLWLIYSIPTRRVALFDWNGRRFQQRALRLR